MMVLYFLDETEKCKLQEEYENSKTCIGMIMVDNYEETFQLLESEEVAQCKAEIDKYIYEWIYKWDGVLVKSERDRYMLF